MMGCGIFCLMFFLRGKTLASAIDASAVASVSILFFGLLMWMGHLGVFDMFAFGFKQLGSMIFSKDARKEGHYYEYKEEKAIKRSNSSYLFVSVIAAGIFLSISIIVLEIIFHASI